MRDPVIRTPIGYMASDWDTVIYTTCQNVLSMIESMKSISNGFRSDNFNHFNVFQVCVSLYTLHITVNCAREDNVIKCCNIKDLGTKRFFIMIKRDESSVIRLSGWCFFLCRPISDVLKFTFVFVSYVRSWHRLLISLEIWWNWPGTTE